MAKLTLSFRGRKLKVFGLGADGVLIGRDSACTIRIDSLAVAPMHARIRAGASAFLLEIVDGHAVTLVNGHSIGAVHELVGGDQIQIGKHTLMFSNEGHALNALESVAPPPSAAWLQIHSGSYLGRTFRLDKAFTRIGRPDGNLAVITRRESGYYLCHLHGTETPQINDHDIGDRSARLHNYDLISVGELKVQFFTHAAIGSDKPQQTSSAEP